MAQLKTATKREVSAATEASAARDKLKRGARYISRTHDLGDVQAVVLAVTAVLSPEATVNGIVDQVAREFDEVPDVAQVFTALRRMKQLDWGYVKETEKKVDLRKGGRPSTSFKITVKGFEALDSKAAHMRAVLGLLEGAGKPMVEARTVKQPKATKSEAIKKRVVWWGPDGPQKAAGQTSKWVRMKEGDRLRDAMGRRRSVKKKMAVETAQALKSIVGT